MTAFPQSVKTWNLTKNGNGTKKRKKLKQFYFSCGAVGSAVTSDTRGPCFESSHRRLLLNNYLLLTDSRKDENKPKRGREWPIFNYLSQWESKLTEGLGRAQSISDFEYHFPIVISISLKKCWIGFLEFPYEDNRTSLGNNFNIVSYNAFSVRIKAFLWINEHSSNPSRAGHTAQT